MELFRQQTKDQTYKDNTSAQPLFDITVVEITSDIDCSKAQYVIMNLGHIISEATIKVVGAKLEGHGFLGVLEQGGGARFTNIYIAEANDVELIVSYLDGLRIHRTNRFKKANDGARNWMLIEGWNGKTIEQ